MRGVSVQLLILVLFLITGTSEYLAAQKWVPHGVTFLQEFLSLCILMYVIALGVRDRFQYVRPAYWVACGFIVLVMACGIVANGVDAGVIFAGARNYLRAIPLFFLGAVLPLTDTQIRRQLRVLLALCFLQIPLAIVQRMHTAARGSFTGDETSGTLLISSILSIFLICAACVLTGMYLRKRLRAPTYLVLVCLILLPTTINETKGTLVLLPIGLLAVFILGSPRRTRVRNAIMATSILAVFLSGFFTIYDYVQRDKPNHLTLVEFFSQGKAEKYLVKNASGLGADPTDVGRVNAIVISAHYLARDPVLSSFGVGIGNASKSSLGEAFQGRYRETFAPYLWLTVVRIGVETGALGLLGIFSILYLIFRDTKYVADRDEGLTGALAVGWIGVVAVISVAMFYKDLILVSALPFLFWYFSGLIAARRCRLIRGSA